MPGACSRTTRFSPRLYRDRNAIERMFGRIKDFRRIATRYDRLANKFLAALCLIATIVKPHAKAIGTSMMKLQLPQNSATKMAVRPSAKIV